MAKDLLEGQSKYWEEDEPSTEGRDLFAEAPQKDAAWYEKGWSGLKKAVAGASNTTDIGGTLAWQGLARLGGKQPNPEVFKALNERIRLRNELVKDDIDPGFLGRLFGLGVTLPLQMLNMPMAHAETGKTFIDEGESLGRAQAAMGVDAAGNAAGMLLPGWKAGSKAVRAITGAGANVGQDTATRLILQQLAEKEKTKDLFAPSLETAALSAVPGAAFAVALGKNKPKVLPKPKADADKVVADFANKSVEDSPYQKTKQEAAADDATAARLEAAIAKQNPQQPPMRVGKDGEAFSATPENIYARDQAEQRQIDLLDEHVHGRFPESIQEDIPFYSTVEEIAARQADPLQADMFVGNQLPPQRPWRAEQAQAALEARQRALEQQVAEQAQLDAAQRQRQAGIADIERRRQEALQGAGAQQARNIHPSATGWNDLQVQRAGEEAAQTHEFLSRNRHQAEFDTTPYGDPGAQFGSTMEHGRVDENGIPIRADLSMEAQNLQNPLQRNLWGDELPGRTGDNGLPLTRALDKMPPGPERDAAVSQLSGQAPNPARLTDDVTSTLNRPVGAQGKFGQGGNVNPEMNDILTLGIPKLFGAIKSKFTGEVPPKVDTPLAPVSPEAIAKKQALAAKSAALGIGENLYAPINTLEEVKAMDGRDIGFDVAGKRRTPGQQLGSGMEGALRRNTANPVLQWLSNMRTKAEANTNASLRKYITGEDGINKTLKRMSDQDKADAYDLALAMDKHRVKYTPELGAKYGLSPEADAFMQSRQRMYDGEYQLGAKVDSQLGIKHFEEHPGVARATFNSAYKAIVGVWEGEGKNRKFVPKTILNANNAWEFRQAKKWWNEEAQRRGLSNYEVKDMPRQGLRTNSSQMRTFDGLAQVFSKLAELNPDFAEAKVAVDELIKGNTKKMGRYDYHSLKKMGVEGSVGRKPWKQAADNIDDFFKAEVESFDEGFRYWNYQDFVNKTAQAQADPILQQKYPNTVAYLQKVKDNVNGQGLNQFGALTNAVLDTVAATTGFGNASAPRKVMSDLRKSMSLLMMGVSNFGFVGIQMGQYWSAGVPEAMRIAKDFDLPFAQSAAKSFSSMLFHRPWLEYHSRMGTLDKVTSIDPVIKDAFVWAKEHGITDFNEISLSHEAAVNPLKQKVEDVLSLPMVVPEVVTRPTMFLWFTDLMKDKLSGEELYVAAKRATDYTMTNYHKDEAPLLYQRSGVMGENIGGLKRYSHNAVEQIVSRMTEMKKYPEAFAAAVGFTLLLQGITGMVGYGVADELSQATTDKPLRHWLEQLIQSPALMDGWVSAMSGMDLNSRFSLAGVVPSNGSAVAETLVGPHAMKLYGLAKASVDAVKNQDQQSFNNLARQAIPSGLYGYYEDKNLVNDEGYVLDKEGSHKYETPRTEGERDFRKHMGIRPLRERIEDESLYADKKAQKRVDEKRIEAVSRMQAAIQLPTAGEDDFKAALQAYQDAEGDVRQIEPLLKKWAEKQAMSARQREILVPTDRAGSIKKYERFWEK